MPRRPQGAGSVYQLKNGMYIAQLDMGRDASGKRIRSARQAKTKKEAQAKLRELEQAFLNRPDADDHDAPARETVATYLDRWFQHCQPRWSPRTSELYRHQIDRHIKPHIGDLPIDALTPMDVQDMVSSIVASGHIPTANKVRTLLYSALKQAVRWEVIHKNPADAVDPIKEPRNEKALWTTEQAQAFIDAVTGHRFYAAFYLLLTTGLRRGELLGLRWEDIGVDGLHVRQTVTLVGKQPHVGPTKTAKSRRFVTLPPDAIAVLEQHRIAQATARRLLGSSWQCPELVFPSEIGTVMHPRNFHRAWRTALRNAGIAHANIHAMRHLHISLLIMQGVDPKTVSERAGHSSTAFTLDRYGHVFLQQRRGAAFSLDKLLAPPSPTEPARSEPQDTDDDDQH